MPFIVLTIILLIAIIYNERTKNGTSPLRNFSLLTDANGNIRIFPAVNLKHSDAKPAESQHIVTAAKLLLTVKSRH